MKETMINIVWPDSPADSNIGMTMGCWVISLAVLLTPFIVQKELAELKAVSVALFVAALSFVALNVGQIAFRGISYSNHDT